MKDLDPIEFIQNTFELNGKPFVLINEEPENARHYLRGIYYAMAFTMPKVKKPMVLVKGRQVEMSTTMSNMIAYYTQTYPYFKTLYVCPSLEQIKRFSGEKISPLLRYKHDPEILNPLKSSGTIEGTFTIRMKQFSNGSTIYLEAASDEGNNIRNIGVDFLIKDEYQDLDENAEGNIDSVLDHSDWAMDMSLGTPKYTNTQYENKWKHSSQHYYHLQCPSCNTWFRLHLESMIKEFIVACPKCKHEEDKRQLMPNGKWMATGAKDSTYLGYHLSQLYVPYKSIEVIRQKLEEKTKLGINVEQYKKNEVLGEFYEGMTQKPPRESIERAYDASLPYNFLVPVSRRVYAGVDWGGWSVMDNDPTQSLSVYAEGVMNDDGVLFVNYMEVLEDKDDILKAERVAELMTKRNVALCIADSGYGKNQCLRLSALFGPRFLKCKYISGASTTLIDTSKEKEESMIKANVDFTLEELYSAMQSGKMKIPRNQYTEWSIEHFMNYEIQLRVSGNHTHKHFVKPPGRLKKVDAVHALNFLRLAALHDTNATNHSDLVNASPELRRRARPMLTGRSLEEAQMMDRMRNMRRTIPRNLTD